MIVVVDFDGIIRASPVRTDWCFVAVPLEAVITCIVVCGKCMRPWLLSITTLLFIIKCNPIVEPIIFFIRTNCSANMIPALSILNVAVANTFSNWPFAWCVWKTRGSSILRRLFGVFCSIVSNSFPLTWHRLFSLRRRLLLGYSQNPEARGAFLVFVSELP